MLLLCRFEVAAAEQPAFAARARRAVALLSAQTGCTAVSAGRATDPAEPGGMQQWALVARFASVTAYRRALSPFEVREHVVPLLAECVDGAPSTYEVLLDGLDGAVTGTTSLLAPDAGTVGRGENPPTPDR